MKKFLIAALNNQGHTLIIILAAFLLTVLPSAAEAAALAKPPNNLGLVGYWTFDEGVGTVATDFSGNGNTGTLVNSPTWTNGRRGKALALNGSSSYVSVANSSSLNPSNLTVSIWAKSNTSTWNGYGFLVSKRDAYLVHPNLGGTSVDFYIYTGTYSAVTCTPSNPITDWNLYSYTWDGTNLTAYINGVQCNTSTPGGSLSTADTGELDIGRDDGFPRYFNGVVDEVRIYNRALSAAEVQKLYSSGAVKFTSSSVDLQKGSSLASGLVGHWTFDGPDVTDKVYDRSGQGNNGYIYNAATSTAKTIGKLGQGLLFDGYDDFVPVNSVSSQVQTGDVTLSMWFKLTSSFTAGAPDEMVLASVSDAVSTNDIELHLSNSDGELTFRTVDSGESNSYLGSTATSWTSGLWYHAVGVITTGVGGGKRLYINGVLDNSDSNNTRGSTYSPIANIGALPDVGITSFGGVLDDVRIYNRALSATEVKQLYRLGSAVIR